MARLSTENALLNASFRFWDYGQSIFLANAGGVGAYSATRWKTITTGTVTGTVSRSTGSTNMAIPKWIRGRDTLKVTIGTMAEGANVTVRQFVEDGQRHGRTIVALTVIMSGPDGATVYAGIGDFLKPMTLRGPDTPVTTTHYFMVGDFVTEHMPVDIFTMPSQVGEYHVHFAQAVVGLDRPKHSGLVIRPSSEDRRLCNRYSRPLGNGLSGPCTDKRMSVPLAFEDKMRTTPTLTNMWSTAAIVNPLTGSAASANPATYTLANMGPSGGRLIIDGFSGLTPGTTMMITNTALGVLHADY